MANFFRLSSFDRWYLVTLIAFSVLAFLPLWREIEIAGMSMLGWWMAILMVFAPSIALLRFALNRKKRRDH